MSCQTNLLSKAFICAIEQRGSQNTETCNAEKEQLLLFFIITFIELAIPLFTRQGDIV